MIFLIVGIFLLVLGFNAAKFTGPLSRAGFILKSLGTLLMTFALLFSALVQIEDGEVGVHGRIKRHVKNTGL